MPDAVGGDFVEGGDELCCARRSQPDGLGVISDQAAGGYQPVRAKGHLPDTRPGLRPWHVQWSARCFELSKDVAPPHVAALGYEFVTPSGLVDHRSVQLFRVVWAEQPPGLAVP